MLNKILVPTASTNSVMELYAEAETMAEVAAKRATETEAVEVDEGESLDEIKAKLKPKKKGGLLDYTQKIKDSAPAYGGAKWKHAGNAIDQVSKIFNDGYKNISKGSNVVNFLTKKGLMDNNLKFRSMNLPDIFLDQDTPENMYKKANLDSNSIEEKVLDLLNSNIVLQKQK